MKEASIRKIIAHRPGLDRHLPVSQPFFQFLAIGFARPFVLFSLPSQTQIAQLLPDSFFTAPLNGNPPEQRCLF
jgi:hypothetical protein